ncbi:isopentenyl-diphosphate Delta-isomerase [Agaribacterium haliotis]|uniref:isopentenyl-diphosphate Delta-isomerase n=1 Tax=Agaribacterium haliotis TaxID=2013869 RepID=UPI000BB57A33|nr:isopentenyl-diphosphate Delta-isomerase [Agaribacterium haliotis]
MTALARDRFAVVSSDSDELILVNQHDEEIGSADKLLCHDGKGMLHRAFSVLLFNQHGELLLQKRAAEKRLWGDFWSNSCCSHPRVGESMHEAARRRVAEELGLEIADLVYLYKFEYHAQFGELGAEHELCSVFIGRCDSEAEPNANEISAVRWLSAAALEAELNADEAAFTPWFKMEWAHINKHFKAELEALYNS